MATAIIDGYGKDRILYPPTQHKTDESPIKSILTPFTHIKGTNIWVVKKTSKGWSEPEYPGPPFDEAMFVCVSDDGTIYNSGLSKSELFNGRYGPWEPITPHLSGPFMHPCIGPDEEYTIFDTDHVLGAKGKSLLISFKNSDGSWGEIISFRDIFDFEKFGIHMLTPDYKYLF